MIAPTVILVTLYLFAIVPIAILWGLAYAIPASIASMLVFNFLFLPPLYTFTLADTENWVALAIFLVIGIVVSELTARVGRRAREAQQREREEALLAELATTFLEGSNVTGELDRIAGRVRDVLGVEAARIELGTQRDPPRGESPYELRARGERIGNSVHQGRATAEPRRAKTTSSGARIAARSRIRAHAPLAGGARDGGTPTQRHDQDGSPPRREP